MARPCGAVFNPTTTNKHNKALKFCKHFCLVFMLLFFCCVFSKSSQLFQFKQHKQSYVMSFMQLVIVNFLFLSRFSVSLVSSSNSFLSVVNKAKQLLQTAKKVALTSDLMLWWHCDPASTAVYLRLLLQVYLASKIDVQRSKLPDSRSHSCME